MEIDNSAVEYTLRGVALGRRNFLFVGAESGSELTDSMYGLVGMLILNGVGPED